MKINEFNRQVNLLEIVNRSKAGVPESGKAKIKPFKNTFLQEMAKNCDVDFSKHARERLFSREIDLSEERLIQLSRAIDKAADKGSKETLILDNEAAYVVSIPNRMVITAFSRANLREGVFTSIDSAVIL